MFKKPALMTAFGIGYVLGARAGRERYDAIAAKAQKLWRDPRVQEKAHRAGDMAKETAETARQTIHDKMPGDTTPSSASTTTSTSTSTTTPSSASTSKPHTVPSTPNPGPAADPVTDVPRGWES
ncbi:YtxH domain-containing protein [Nocardioides luteus]|nr:YtxH domain-containing protein [Nocardioides luteus]